MTRFPKNYELFRRSIYVSKAWQAHSTFTPEEVAHVTKLNKRVAELTDVRSNMLWLRHCVRDEDTKSRNLPFYADTL